MSITIYHNPDCGTSRNTLALIRNSGAEPTVIYYLETPPSGDELRQLLLDVDLDGFPVHNCFHNLFLLYVMIFRLNAGFDVIFGEKEPKRYIHSFSFRL